MNIRQILLHHMKHENTTTLVDYLILENLVNDLAIVSLVANLGTIYHVV